MKNLDRKGEKVLFEDCWNYEIGPFSEPYNPEREVHYTPKSIDQGKWTDMVSHHLCKRDKLAWIIKNARGNKKCLCQTGRNRIDLINWKYYVKKYILRRKTTCNLFYPMLAAGDKDWRDITVECDFMPLDTCDISGLHFRCANGRQHYIYGYKKGKLLLLKRNHNHVDILAKKKYTLENGKTLSLKVELRGAEMKCHVDGQWIFSVRDNSFPAGRTGILSNVPAEFYAFRVSPTTGKENPAPMQEKRTDAEGIKDYPPMEAVKKIKLPHPPSGRSLRFAPPTDRQDGKIILAQGYTLKSDHNIINYIAAMNWQGEVLWEKGKPVDEKKILCADLPVQIYDIDNDGEDEVICCLDSKLIILDGNTGEIKRQADNPQGMAPGGELGKIVGDSITICNLRGREKPQDILLKDRYSKIWAFDNELDLLWGKATNTGHFPYPVNIEGNGKDQIFCGYSLLDSTGNTIWELPIGDHADAIAIFKPEGGEWLGIIAASDEGLIFLDPLKGKIKKQLKIGHMQTVTVAKLRDDISGLQVATNTYWGNPGINYLLTLEGDVVETYQPSIYGATIYPVNWTGDGLFLLLMTASPGKDGGLFNGKGKQVVAFPEDGHPELCCQAISLAADKTDGIAVWDFNELWFYTREGEPRKTAIAPAISPFAYNESSYRANIRIPINGPLV